MGGAEAGRGLAYGFSAYLLWGVLPLYFVLLSVLDPFEIVAGRILLTLGFCAILLTALRQWPETVALLRDRRALLRLAAAGAVIYVNWQVFVIASTTGHVLDASLGYFINPVVTVLFAVLLLGERLSPVQWTAIGLTVVAFAIIAVGYGIFPWTGLLLALSFGFYSYLKSKVGGRTPALAGLFTETLVLSPVALAILGMLAATSGLSSLAADDGTRWLFLLSGAATAVPLLFFAEAARRLSLSAVGFMQYIGPTIMFFVGWLALGEEIPVARWIGFGVVWAALALLSFDTVRRARHRKVAFGG